MQTVIHAGPTPEQLAHYRDLPLKAKSIEEFETLLRQAYNALYDLTFPVKRKRRQPFPIRHVGALGQLTEPNGHEVHFRFDKPDLNIRELRLKLTVHQYRNSSPREDHWQCMSKWFSWLVMSNGSCGYGNRRQDGSHEDVHQYNFPLWMFPHLADAVREYHAQVLAKPYGEAATAARKKAFPGFDYLCRHS